MLSSQEIAARIKAVAKEKNITLSSMLSSAGLGRNTMVHFETSMPKADNLGRIADALSCSVDYLLGRTERITIAGPGDDDFPEDEKILLDRYRQLDSMGQEIVRAKAGELLQNLQWGTDNVGAENEGTDS